MEDTMNFKTFSAATTIALLSFSAIPAQASKMTFEQKVSVCAALKESNDMGVSGKSLLIEKYGRAAAAGIMAEIKSTCPRVY